MIISLFTTIGLNIATNTNDYLPVINDFIKLILVGYFAFNLDNYNNAKIAILLVVLVEVITYILTCFIIVQSIVWVIVKLIHVIPCVSLALTYFARYNKEGFKELSK